MKILKKYWNYILVLAIIIIVTTYWFLGKLFPTQNGSWSKQSEAVFDDSEIPSSEWENKNFWIATDFPGKQNVCFSVLLNNKLSERKIFTLNLTQSPRAYSYPVVGDLADFFALMNPAQVEERIRQEKPYYIGHLFDRISREGKDLFLLGDNEKFLIPKKSLFSFNFPTKEIPAPKNETSSLPYANVLISFPEGILVSDGKGVFVISQGRLFLIRSPEVFEAMGYKWEDIIQMDSAEQIFKAYTSGDLIDFDAANPNGTILKDGENLFLVWEDKLYSLTSAEFEKYFSRQPLIAVNRKGLSADCSTDNSLDRIDCCVSDFDPRLNPPSYSPYSNTLKWDMSVIAEKTNIKKLNWQATIILDKENIFRRLISLKNFVLYTSGILK